MRSAITLAGSALMLVGALAAGQAPTNNAPNGELTYTTYCIACHTTQIHWREKKLATDWTSLRSQVRHWLLEAGTAATEDDIAAVAGYLNGLYYNFPVTDAQRLSMK